MNYALVTGASRGLGKAIALQLAKDLGLHIIINYSSNKTAAEDTLSQIKEAGGSGEIMQFNVQDKEAVDNALNKWAKDNPDEFIPDFIELIQFSKDTELQVALACHLDWVKSCSNLKQINSEQYFNIVIKEGQRLFDHLIEKGIYFMMVFHVIQLGFVI